MAQLAQAPVRPHRVWCGVQVAEALVVVHGELILIHHPFRDGNGRVARLLALRTGQWACPLPLSRSYGTLVTYRRRPATAS